MNATLVLLMLESARVTMFGYTFGETCGKLSEVKKTAKQKKAGPSLIGTLCGKFSR